MSDDPYENPFLLIGNIIACLFVIAVFGTLLGFLIAIFTSHGPRDSENINSSLGTGYVLVTIIVIVIWLVGDVLPRWAAAEEERERRNKKEEEQKIAEAKRILEQEELLKKRSEWKIFCIYSAYIHLQKAREIIEIYKKYQKEVADYENITAQNQRHREIGAALEREILLSFHSFRRESVLLPNPILSDDHAWRVFAELFPHLPVGQDKNLEIYAYYATSEQRELLKLPNPLPPQKAIPPKPFTASKHPIDVRNYDWWRYQDTWGSLEEWKKVNGKYQPTYRYAKNIPQGPKDQRILTYPMYLAVRTDDAWNAIGKTIDAGFE